MSGGYCRFCDHRCFVLRTVPDGPHGGEGWHMATCVRGKQHDREALGYDADTAINPAEADEDTCTECGREVSRPGLCFDCDVEGSYVGGLAPRFGSQP